MNTVSQVDEAWHEFIKEQREEDLNSLIADEKLKPEETRKLVEGSFRDGSLKTTGTAIDRILPPTSRFSGGNRMEKKKSVVEKLISFFEKYFGVA